jgi:peptide/nickel transport system substrate-binding protein
VELRLQKEVDFIREKGIAQIVWIVVAVVVVIIIVAAVALSMRKAGTPYSVSVSISPSTQSGDAGTTITYTVTVQNKGTKSDSYSLAVTDNAGWSQSLSPTSLSSVSAGSSGTSTLSVTVPSSASGGDTDSLTVTVTSQENASVSTSSSCTARVSSTYGVAISISPSSQKDLRGALLTYDVTINNLGNATDTYTLTATDTLMWSPSLPSSLTVLGGVSGSATLSVTIPTDATDNSIDNITVTASGTGVSDSSTCTAQVLPTPTLSVKNPGTLVFDDIGDVDSLDPAWSYDTRSSEVIQNVYETLVSFADGSLTEFVPKLAENWTISTDGLTYTFTIRSGVKFQNGDTMTPKDVAYSIKRALVQDRDGGPVWMLLEPLMGVGTFSTRDENGNIAITFEQIDNAVTVEGDSVVFHLKQPYGPFMQILTQSWASIVDENWCIAQGDWPGTAATYAGFNNPPAGTVALQDKMNGTGPFKFDRWEHTVQIVLLRNDNYWGTPPKLQSVVIKEVDTWSARKLELLAGDADFAYVPRANIPEVENIPGIRVTNYFPELMADAIFFNFDIDPTSQWIGSGKLDGNGIPTDFFSDKNVRLGFVYSFDWDTFIRDAELGQATQPASPVIEGLPYVDPNAKKYSLDLAKAENYFRQAFGGAVWENGFKLTILYNTGNDPRRIAAEILKQNIESLNPKFSITIESRDWSTYLNEMIAGSLTLYYLGWQADYADPHNFVSAFMSSEGALSAFQHYNNPTVDNLISAGIVEPDPAKRQAIYYQLQQIYYDDVPSVMVDQAIGLHVERDWVSGWYYNPLIPGTPWGGDYYPIGKGYY